jgi:hypothetical protein
MRLYLSRLARSGAHWQFIPTPGFRPMGLNPLILHPSRANHPRGTVTKSRYSNLSAQPRRVGLTPINPGGQRCGGGSEKAPGKELAPRPHQGVFFRMRVHGVVGAGGDLLLCLNNTLVSPNN